MMFKVVILIVLIAVFVLVIFGYIFDIKDYGGVLSNSTEESKVKKDIESSWQEGLPGLFESFECPNREGFEVVCANKIREKAAGETHTIFERIGECGIDCYNSPGDIDLAGDSFWSSTSEWKISPNCSTLKHDAPYKDEYDDWTISLYDNASCYDSDDNKVLCKRDGKSVGHCLRLNFTKYYSEPPYIGSLCYRSDAGCYFPPGTTSTCKDIPPNLYIFTFDGGELRDRDDWEIVENPKRGDNKFDSSNAFKAVTINRRVKAIDICPQGRTRNTAPHKIPWVKYTTNSTSFQWIKGRKPCNPDDSDDVLCSERIPTGGKGCVSDNGYEHVLECVYRDQEDCVAAVSKKTCPSGCEDSSCQEETIECDSCSDCNKRISKIDWDGAKVKLTEDITTNENCINLKQWEDITFTCAGHSINAENTMPRGGIDLTRSTNVKVKDCNITGFQNAVLFHNSKSTKITNNNFTDNEKGVLSLSSKDVDIENNKIKNNKKAGIYNSGSKVHISGNKICYNTDYDLYCASGGKFSGGSVFDETNCGNKEQLQTGVCG